MNSASSQDGNGDEATNEEDVEQHGEESKEGLAADEACEEDSKGSIDDGSTSYALNSLHPGRNGIIAAAKHWTGYQQRKDTDGHITYHPASRR